MKNIIFIIVVMLFSCSSLQNKKKVIFNNLSFSKEINVYIDYLNSIDVRNESKFIEVLQVNTHTFSFYTSNIYTDEQSHGFIKHKNRYVIFDSKINIETINDWLNIELRDLKQIDCEKCKSKYLDGYSEPLELATYSYNNNNFVLKSGCFGVDLMKYISIRAKFEN